MNRVPARPGELRVFLKYAATGVLAFAIDTSVTLALAQVIHYLAANTVGFLVANACQFVLAHRWVFGHTERRLSLPALYASTLSISALGLVASNAIVFAMVAGLHAALWQAKVAASLAGLALNFALRRRFVYRDSRG